MTIHHINYQVKAIPILSIVVPCYNEEDVLPETFARLESLLAELVLSEAISNKSAIWLVDDGSTDRTWHLISRVSDQSGGPFRGIKLSRNQGHQIALYAGLMTAKGDVLISIDADLQDDLNVINQMLDAFKGGDDIVYGVRSSRRSDNFFKRTSAEMYYYIMDKLGVEIVFNHADFRLMSRRSVEALRKFPESNIFLRGLVPLLGFSSSIVQYERLERFAGDSKYPLMRMLSLAWQGVTSFSVFPLRAITTLGILVSIISLAMAFWALYVKLFSQSAVPGWASMVIPLFLISGVQLLSLGLIGEYLAKVFVESKKRPLYFLDQLAMPPECDYEEEFARD